MIYIGIDASYSSTGLIHLDENAEIKKQKILKFNKKETDTEDRLIKVKEDLIFPIMTLNSVQKIKVCLEGPSYNSQGQRILQMGALNFFIRYWFRVLKIDYRVVEPNTLKKFVTGKGNCKKDLILLKVFKKWGVEFDVNDLADAYGLARMILEEDINEEG